MEPVSLFYILILDIQKIIMSTFSYFSLAGECEGIQISSATKEKATRAKVNIIILVNIIIIKIVTIILLPSFVDIHEYGWLQVMLEMFYSSLGSQHKSRNQRLSKLEESLQVSVGNGK